MKKTVKIESVNHCTGNLCSCPGKPVYIAIVKGLADCFNRSLWCESCMGESYREGNPYLQKIDIQEE